MFLSVTGTLRTRLACFVSYIRVLSHFVQIWSKYMYNMLFGRLHATVTYCRDDSDPRVLFRVSHYPEPFRQYTCTFRVYHIHPHQCKHVQLAPAPYTCAACPNALLGMLGSTHHLHRTSGFAFSVVTESTVTTVRRNAVQKGHPRGMLLNHALVSFTPNT